MSGVPTIGRDQAPKFDEDHWEDLERILEAPLDDSRRERLRQIAEHYVIDAHFADVASMYSSPKVRGRVSASGKVKDSSPLLRLLRSMQDLSERWKEAMADPETNYLLTHYLSQASPWVDLEEIAGQIHVHTVRLRAHAAQDQNDLSPFEWMILSLEKFWLDVKGELPDRTNNGSDAIGEEPAVPTTSFVSFVWRLHDCLPDAVRFRDDALRNLTRTWAQRVYRAQVEIRERHPQGD